VSDRSWESIGTQGTEDVNDTNVTLAGASGGDRGVFDALFAHHRPRLLRMAKFRLDSRLLGRIDPVDVVQEVHRFVEAQGRVIVPRKGSAHEPPIAVV
jgi:hypothetical protein